MRRQSSSFCGQRGRKSLRQSIHLKISPGQPMPLRRLPQQNLPYKQQSPLLTYHSPTSTSVGMKPLDGQSLIDPSLLRKDLVVRSCYFCVRTFFFQFFLRFFRTRVERIVPAEYRNFRRAFQCGRNLHRCCCAACTQNNQLFPFHVYAVYLQIFECITSASSTMASMRLIWHLMSM